MARRPRFAPPHYPLHITQRGNYRQPTFFIDADRLRFIELIEHYADPRQILLHGYAIMSNHFHLVATPQIDDGASRFLQRVTSQYAQYLHGRLRRRGRLWQGRFYSCVLDPHHFLTALAYVDLNPARARMVDDATAYRWSSAATNAGLLPTPAWLDIKTLRRHFPPDAWLARLRQPQSRSDLAAIRQATQAEQPLGLPGFVQELETKFHVRFTPLPLGRPARKLPAPEPSAEIARSSAG